MKNRKTYGLIIACMCRVVDSILLPALALSQTEPCSVEITATCDGSTDCSGILSGSTEIKNTGTTAIMCQVGSDTSGSGAGGPGGIVGEEIVLLPQELSNYGFWVAMPIGEIPFWDFHPITKTGTSTADCFVTDNPAITCNVYKEWECSATCDPTPVSVDIKLSSISLKGKGLLPVVIMGADDFDTTAVDPATLRLGREGVRDMVVPIRWNYKSDDLWLKFDKIMVFKDLMLGDVAGQEVQLIITGKLKNEFGRIPFMGSVGIRVVQ
jgi:hypothetical protein